ncbi:S49 family peptidase [Paraburkholderia sp. RL17-383-BIF-A]|uniref:S49 family peptidase n=1 Tax=Paraburkholderia sp. RL17-383-BIF-A TaxID=3031631 RepID=UPI0038B8C346
MIIEPSQISAQLLNSPMALHPGYFPAAMAVDARSFDEPAYGEIAYGIVGGIAVIPVLGVLLQSLGTTFSWGDATGYDGIRFNFLHALENPDVEAIVLHVASGGGAVAGCFDLADLIYDSRGKKPIAAICAEHAYSAAYALASAADVIFVPRTGGTGSIGIITAHIDVSKALDKAGIKVTFITYGEQKADGNPEIPLTDEALKAIQDDVDKMGELFCETVARNRNLPVEKVRGMQAGTFLGAAGIKAGLADVIAAPDEAFKTLLAELG